LDGAEVCFGGLTFASEVHVLASPLANLLSFIQQLVILGTEFGTFMRRKEVERRI